MAKVVLPLLSAGASGTLGKAIVYRDRSAFVSACPYKKKRDFQSVAQLDQRRLFWEAKEVWGGVSEALKTALLGEAAKEHLNAWNWFLRKVLRGEIRGAVVGQSRVGGADLVWTPPCPW